MRLTSGIPALLLLGATAAHASVIFSGTFTHDDDKIIFDYSVGTLTSVTVATTSYGLGGPGSGFIPVLSLFDTSGNYLFENSGYAGNSDASLSWNSAPGFTYRVVLTEWDNVSKTQGNISDGFTEDGQGDFTSTLYGFGTGPFSSPDGTALTGNWSVTFASTDPAFHVAQVAAVPEPGTAGLLLGGVILLAGRAAAQRRSRRNS